MIPAGTTGFQIKASNLSPKQCITELHVENKTQNPLKPEVLRLLENNGTYVLVLLASMTDRSKRARKEAIVNELAIMGFARAKVQVYSVSQIIGFTERFIGLVAWLKGYPNDCIPYDEWAKMGDINKPTKFVADTIRANIIKEIQIKLRIPSDKTPIYRVTGLSGLGKTRPCF